MVGNPQSSRWIAFGPFEVNPSTGELRKNGTRVRLPRQPFQILLALLSRPGEAVSREELRQLLWREDTFVDFEHSLNAAINKLRQALGDSADRPRYIETLPNHGYRFIALVANSRPAPLQIVPALPPQSPAGQHQRSRFWIWVGAAGLLFVVGLFVRWITVPKPGTAGLPVQFTVPPPAGSALQPGGSRQGFAVSPDGTRLAFTALQPDGLYTVWLRDFSALQPRPLPNTEGTHSLFWSSDGGSLLFTLRGTLRRTSPAGDSFQILCEGPRLLRSGTSLPDGRILLSSLVGDLLVSGQGGPPQPVANEKYRWPQSLPDGRNILHIAYDPRIQRFRARYAPLGSPESAKDLLEVDSRVVYAPSQVRPGSGYLLYIRAGNLLAQPFNPETLRVSGDAVPLISNMFYFQPTGAADFSVSNTGVLVYQSFAPRSQIAWLDRQGRELALASPSNLGLKYVRLSPDGRKAAAPVFDSELGANQIWVFDTASGEGRLVIAGPGLLDAPVWSPDSRRLVYLRAFGGPPKLFIKGLGDKDQEEVLPPGEFQVPTDWSPDGRFIAYANTEISSIPSENEGDVWVIDLQHDRRVMPLLNTPFHETAAVFSPDGRWVAFISNESGRPEAYLQAFQSADTVGLTGERIPISRRGAVLARWRRDGKELFYLGTDGRVYSVPVSLSPTLRIGSPAPLFTISTQARAALPTSFGFDVSEDGRRFLVPVVHGDGPSFVVVQNWEALLRR